MSLDGMGMARIDHRLQPVANEEEEEEEETLRMHKKSAWCIHSTNNRIPTVSPYCVP